ncbi:DUF3311 domain-containing protein [Streptomyces xiaopingdaonensis]|uniref:DUF3311 domain-containing protein n=1 Tax=Streptomyces xiaopingdaonensis TaxID=1565415 RepID=UPI0002EE5C08|nr:DUF3311 domain-containing protein [Streptomyces xiaopingdaonensis]
MRTRPQLLWLLAPHVLYLAAVPLVNRVQPTLFGVPFLVCWLLFATLATPPLVHLAHRADRRRVREARRRAGSDSAPGEGS